MKAYVICSKKRDVKLGGNERERENKGERVDSTTSPPNPERKCWWIDTGRLLHGLTSERALLLLLLLAVRRPVSLPCSDTPTNHEHEPPPRTTDGRQTPPERARDQPTAAVVSARLLHQYLCMVRLCGAASAADPPAHRNPSSCGPYASGPTSSSVASASLSGTK